MKKNLLTKLTCFSKRIYLFFLGLILLTTAGIAQHVEFVTLQDSKSEKSFSFLVNDDSFTDEYFTYIEGLPVMDPFSSPNVHLLDGKNKYDYYGSGDVNNDEIINQEDVDLIMNQQITSKMLKRADVNGDGKVDFEDASLMEKYIRGETDYLPGHWDKLNLQPDRKDLKLDWLRKRVSYYIENVQKEIPGWDYKDYSQLFCFNFMGIEKFSNSQYASKYLEYVSEMKENIPLYYAHMKVNNQDLYFETPAVFIGADNPAEKDDLFDLNQWYIFNYSNGEMIEPGDYHMDPNYGVSFSGFYYNKHHNYYTSTILIQFDLVEGIFHLQKDMQLPDGDYGTIINFIEQGGRFPQVFENPWHLKLEYLEKPDTAETGIVTEESTAYFNRQWESNSEYYLSRVKEEKKEWEKKAVNQDYPDYEYDCIRTDSVFLNVGRHSYSDVRRYFNKVRDNEAPVFSGADTTGALTPVVIKNWKDNGIADVYITPENPEIGFPEVYDNSTYPVDFSWSFKPVNDGNNKYLIEYTATDKSINKNTSAAYQEIIVEDVTPAGYHESTQRLVAYPNPAKGIVYFNWNRDSENVKIEVYDVAGTLISNGWGNYNRGEKIKIKLTDQNGIYIIKLISEKQTEKFIITNH